MNPVALVRAVLYRRQIYTVLVVWCPGCEIIDPDGHKHGGLHFLPINGTGHPVWDWNRDLVTVTLNPSILTKMHRSDNEFVCHSYLRDGQWQFLSDCTHSLVNQTVPMVPLPDWVVNEDS